MAPMFGRALLYFGLSVIGAFKCAAAAIAMPVGDAHAVPFAVDAAFPGAAQPRSQEPPLRLALALNSLRRPAQAPRFDIDTETVALKMSRETSSSRASQTPAPESIVQTPPRPALPSQPAPAIEASMWEVMPTDRTLNTTFSRWAAAAGWQLVWDLEVDFPIEARAVLSGSFEEAITKVAQSMSNASLPIQATFYAGNRVLRIVAKGSK